MTPEIDDIELDLSGLDGIPSEEEGGELNDLNIDFSDFEESTNTDNAGEEASDEDAEPGTEGGDDKPSEEDESTDDKKEDKEVEGDSGSDDADNTLSEIDDILKGLSDDSEESGEDLDEAQKIIESLKLQEGSAEAVTLLEELRTKNQEQQASLTELQSTVAKLNKEKGDLNLKNAELELYGGADDAKVVFLNGNITKARAGDEKAKHKIVGILDDIRRELIGKSMEEEEHESFDSKIERFGRMHGGNGKGKPNLKGGAGVDDFMLEL